MKWHEKFVQTFDSIASLLRGLLVLGVIVSAPFLLAYKCDRDKREAADAARRKAELEETFRKAREANFLRSMAPEKGYHPIRKASDLVVGLMVYRKPELYARNPSAGPVGIGTVAEVGDEYVVLKRASAEVGSLVPWTSNDAGNRIQSVFRDSDFASGEYVTLFSPDKIQELKEQITKEGSEKLGSGK